MVKTNKPIPRATNKARPKKPKPKAKLKPPKIVWDSAEVLAVYDRETTKVCTQMESQIEAHLRELNRKKNELSAVRKAHEQAVSQLGDHIRDREENRGRPPQAAPSLFTNQEQNDDAHKMMERMKQLERENEELQRQNREAAKNAPKLRELVAGVANSTTMNGNPEPTRWFPEDLWKRYPLDRLKEYGLSANDVKILASGKLKEGKPFPMETMGDVNLYTTPTESGWTRKLVDLAGFGEASFSRWEDSHAKFWGAWGNGLDATYAQECGFTKPTDAEPEKPKAKGKRRGNSNKPATVGGDLIPSGEGAGGESGGTGTDEYGFTNSDTETPADS